MNALQFRQWAETWTRQRRVELRDEVAKSLRARREAAEVVARSRRVTRDLKPDDDLDGPSAEHAEPQPPR